MLQQAIYQRSRPNSLKHQLDQPYLSRIPSTKSKNLQVQVPNIHRVHTPPISNPSSTRQSQSNAGDLPFPTTTFQPKLHQDHLPPLPASNAFSQVFPVRSQRVGGSRSLRPKSPAAIVALGMGSVSVFSKSLFRNLKIATINEAQETAIALTLTTQRE